VAPLVPERLGVRPRLKFNDTLISQPPRLVTCPTEVHYLIQLFGVNPLWFPLNVADHSTAASGRLAYMMYMRQTF
jgi:hypothetical protein